MRRKRTFTLGLREGGSTEGYNQPDIKQIGMTIEQGERM